MSNLFNNFPINDVITSVEILFAFFAGLYIGNKGKTQECKESKK